MRTEEGLTMRKFILTETAENEISGHIFEYEVAADWLFELDSFPGWDKYNGYFRVLDLDGEIVGENEIVAGSSVSRESTSGRGSGITCLTYTRRFGRICVGGSCEPQYETVTTCIYSRGTHGDEPGIHFDENHESFGSSAADPCPPEHIRINGNCISYGGGEGGGYPTPPCVLGYVRDENGNCVSRPPCATGYVRDGSGNCISETGFTVSKAEQKLKNLTFSQLRNKYAPRMQKKELNYFDNNLTSVQKFNYLKNAYLAEETIKDLSPNNALLHNDQWDALRHAYLHGLTSENLSTQISKTMGDLHEDWSGNPSLEKQMDLFNNQKGRDTYTVLVSKNLTGHYYNVGLLISLIELMNNGGLKKLQNGTIVNTP